MGSKINSKIYQKALEGIINRRSMLATRVFEEKERLASN
jgi:hypothetical protein